MSRDVRSYQASALSVHDGDTLTASIRLFRFPVWKRLLKYITDRDLGFHIYIESGWLVLHAPIRLLGCNARELAQDGGLEAAANLRALLPVGTQVTLQTVAADKWGTRWDAAVTMPDGSDLVSGLIAQQWLAAWDGTGPKPVPPWPRTVDAQG